MAKARRSTFTSDQEIIDLLGPHGVIAEYQSLGVRFVTTTPNEKGWVDCHGVGREDANPSAGVHLTSGYFNDFGAGGSIGNGSPETRHTLFEFAALHGPYTDFAEAKRHYAEKVGIELRGKKNPDRHLKLFPLDDGHERLWRLYCLKKPGITLEALKVSGAQPGRYREAFPVIALPVVGGSTLDPDHPVGRVMLPIGNDLPVLNKDGSVRSREKMKTAGGSDGGLIIAPRDLEILRDPQRRKDIQAVWKVEGVTDFLAFLSHLPTELAGKVIPVTNSDGCSGKPTPAMLQIFNDLTVFVVGDADEPGDVGARRWAEAIATHAKQTTQVRISEDVSRKHGKDLRDCFTADNWTYHDLTDQAAKFPAIDRRPKPFSNYVEVPAGDSLEIEPLTLVEIADKLQARVSRKIYRLGSTLFIDEERESKEIRWLTEANKLFTWIREELDPIQWKDRKDGLVKRSELFEYLRNNVRQYRQISKLPHQPFYRDTYYMCDHEPTGDGTYIRQLIEFFNPADDVDQSLILALLLTTFWGEEGNEGARPIFVITSNHGRGSGKSKLAEKIGMLSGGFHDFGQFERSEEMNKRFVDPSCSDYRVVRIDNIKTNKFSSADIEAKITQPVYQGHRMYEGQVAVPNRFTWIFTVNGPSLSRDLAERAIIIKINKPPEYNDWELRINEFISRHRREIICDILAILAEKIDLSHFRATSRWSRWERSVLARCCHPETLAETQAAIKARSEEVDADGNEIEIFNDFIERKLSSLGEINSYDITYCKVHIPSSLIARWWGECFRDGKNNKAVWALLNQYSDQNQGEEGLKKNPSRKHGRGYIFTRGECQAIDYDLERRMDMNGKSF